MRIEGINTNLLKRKVHTFVNGFFCISYEKNVRLDIHFFLILVHTLYGDRKTIMMSLV